MVFTWFFRPARFCATASGMYTSEGLSPAADDPDDREVRRLAALVADGDGGPGLQLVLGRVGRVDQRDVGARARGGERPARAELARAERAEFAAPDVDARDAEVTGGEV